MYTDTGLVRQEANNNPTVQISVTWKYVGLPFGAPVVTFVTVNMYHQNVLDFARLVSDKSGVPIDQMILYCGGSAIFAPVMLSFVDRKDWNEKLDFCSKMLWTVDITENWYRVYGTAFDWKPKKTREEEEEEERIVK